MSNARVILAGMLAAMATLAACSGFAVHGQQTPYGTGMQPTPRSGVTGAVAKSGTSRPSEVRRVCRNSTIGTGWIAIDYVADSAGCSGIARSATKYPVALVADY